MSPVIGIDPGLDGAIAIIDNDQLRVYDMPTIVTGNGKRMVDILDILDLLDGVFPGDIWLEDVNAGAVKSITSAFAFGRGYGRIEGALYAARRTFHYVSSPVWTKAVGLPAKASKDEHRELAVRLFPDAVSFFMRSKDGRADAALIAWHGARVMGQNR